MMSNRASVLSAQLGKRSRAAGRVAQFRLVRAPAAASIYRSAAAQRQSLGI